MAVYVDSSALLKRYLDEPDGPAVREALLTDLDWITANHTYTEVVRTLHRVLPERSAGQQVEAFTGDWARTAVVAVDGVVCRRAAEIAIATGVRTLDALHLAAADRAGADLPFLTCDVRQAVAARALGIEVVRW
ncbi:MAG: type II toxin-antitoxin system VapC family toxin [Angustibacter sp.]